GDFDLRACKRYRRRRLDFDRIVRDEYRDVHQRQVAAQTVERRRAFIVHRRPFHSQTASDGALDERIQFGSERVDERRDVQFGQIAFDRYGAARRAKLQAGFDQIGFAFRVRLSVRGQNARDQLGVNPPAGAGVRGQLQFAGVAPVDLHAPSLRGQLDFQAFPVEVNLFFRDDLAADL